jgi:ribosomal protein S18 acetylase RimI-like enzyme
MNPVEIRRELRPGDLGAIVAHHGQVYGLEYGVDATFEGHVAAAVARAANRGFPSEREAICIVERDGYHAGSIGLTDEGNDEAALRWVVLDATLRGHGLGRRLVGEMLARAQEYGYAQVWLETFSELEAAAHLYREHGFRLVSEDTAPRWGRDSITYQRYELELGDRPQAVASMSALLGD